MARKTTIKTAPSKPIPRKNTKTKPVVPPETKANAAVETKPIAGKLGMVAKAVAESTGASLGELEKATGWQPHTVRAALSRLRKRGMTITLTPVGDRKVYVARVAA